MAKAKKSAFVTGLASNKEALKKAAETERAVLADQSEVAAVYGLDKAGARVSVLCKLVSVKCDIHETGDSKGLPYVNWVFSPLEAPGKGMLIGNFQPGYNRKTKVIDGDSLGWIFGEFQVCGFDTKSWANDPSEIETAAEELDKEKPTVMLSIRANEIKKGERAGQIAINYSIARLIEDASSQENLEDPQEEETLEEELDAAMTKEPEVAPEPPPATTKVTKTKATKKKTFKVGDEVKFNFKNDDDEIEVITASIVEMNGDEIKVSDDQFDYDIKISDVL